MLFEIRNNKALPTVFALLKTPYKDIWNNDESPDKHKAIQYFTYLDLLLNPRRSNPFYNLPESVRIEKVCSEVFKDPKYSIPSDLMLATIAYKEDLENMAQGYATLTEAENSLYKLQTFLHNLEPSAKTPSGTLLLKPKDIIMASKELPSAIENIRKAKERVIRELDESVAKTINQRTPNKYEV
jgi:hypothetical protein